MIEPTTNELDEQRLLLSRLRKRTGSSPYDNCGFVCYLCARQHNRRRACKPTSAGGFTGIAVRANVYAALGASFVAADCDRDLVLVDRYNAVAVIGTGLRRAAYEKNRLRLAHLKTNRSRL